LNLYQKQRIKEIQIEVEDTHHFIPYSSALPLTNYSGFEGFFFDVLENEKWVEIVSKMFTICIVNLLISRKITATYFEDKHSILFNLIQFKTEGFKIQPEEHAEIAVDDMLTNQLLFVLQKANASEKRRFSLVINRVINHYLGKETMNTPEKAFFYEYFIAYSNKNPWLKLTKDKNLFGLITNYVVEIDEEKKNTLKKLHNEINLKTFQLRKEDVYFRHFLTHVHRLITRDFRGRYAGD
jgi:hypothetical protein